MPAKSKEAESNLDKLLVVDNKFQAKNGLRRITDTIIIVETLKTLMREDKKVKSSTTLEDLQDICRKFKIKGYRGKEKESVLELVQEHFINQIKDGANFSDLYKELFAKNEIVYLFPEYALNEDAVPKKDTPKQENINYTIETLGTGEYPTDSSGKTLPHPDDFVDEVIYEIVHMLSHLSGDHLYDPNKQPDFSTDLFESEKIYLQVQYVNPLDLV